MDPTRRLSTRARTAALLLATGWLPLALAQPPGAHVHGQAALEIAVDGDVVHIHLHSPLDSLVGFEHAPRNEKERQAIKALTARLHQADTLFVLTPEARCQVESTELSSPVLSPDSSPRSHFQEERQTLGTRAADGSAWSTASHGTRPRLWPSGQEYDFAFTPIIQLGGGRPAAVFALPGLRPYPGGAGLRWEDTAGTLARARLLPPSSYRVTAPMHAGKTLSTARIASQVAQADHDEEAHAHAELEAAWQFRCARPQALRGIEVRLFQVFPDLQRIDAAVAAPGGQSGARLSPGSTRLAW